MFTIKVSFLHLLSIYMTRKYELLLSVCIKLYGKHWPLVIPEYISSSVFVLPVALSCLPFLFHSHTKSSVSA